MKAVPHLSRGALLVENKFRRHRDFGEVVCTSSRLARKTDDLFEVELFVALFVLHTVDLSEVAEVVRPALLLTIHPYRIEWPYYIRFGHCVWHL